MMFSVSLFTSMSPIMTFYSQKVTYNALSRNTRENYCHVSMAHKGNNLTFNLCPKNTHFIDCSRPAVCLTNDRDLRTWTEALNKIY